MSVAKQGRSCACSPPKGAAFFLQGEEMSITNEHNNAFYFVVSPRDENGEKVSAVRGEQMRAQVREAMRARVV